MNLSIDPIIAIAICIFGGSIFGCSIIIYNECCIYPIEIVNEGNTAPNTPESSVHNDILDPRNIEVGYLNESR